jgi:uncharacterized RDD family membrane protein YckC
MMTEIAVPVVHTVSQAGFWRRAFALMIDTFAIHAVLVLAGMLLFAPTGGFVRIGELSGLNRSACASTATSIQRGGAAQTTRITFCESALLGVVHDRWSEAAEETQSGFLTVTRSVRTPVDAAGRPMRAFYLDQLLVLLLAAYLGIAEWLFGTTLGKRVVGVRVRSQDGSSLQLGTACRRLLRFMPALPLIPAAVVAAAIPAEATALSVTYWVLLLLYVLSAVLWVAVLANFVMAVINDDLPWHDRWARTEVVMAR